jgi:hypothetical protein
LGRMREKRARGSLVWDGVGYSWEHFAVRTGGEGRESRRDATVQQRPSGEYMHELQLNSCATARRRDRDSSFGSGDGTRRFGGLVSCASTSSPEGPLFSEMPKYSNVEHVLERSFRLLFTLRDDPNGKRAKDE